MKRYDDDSEDLIDYIEGSSTSFFVKKRFKSGIVTFGKFSSLKEAEAATSLLIINKWNLTLVSEDPLIRYQDEFWVFIVADNRLKFDKKFSSFESAVEYLEVSQKCNVYHNDIFSKRRKRKKRELPSTNEFLEIKEKYIHKEGDKFVINRNLKHANFQYGEFDSLEEAKIAKQFLMDNKWNIKNDSELFFYNNYYWIFKFSEGVLILLDKKESYEDAFDFIDSLNKDPYEMSDNTSKTEFDLFKTKNLPQINAQKHAEHQSVKSTRNVKPKNISSVTFFINLNNGDVNDNHIWRPTPKYNHSNRNMIQIQVERAGIKIKKLQASLKFKFYEDSYDVTIEGNNIKGDNVYSINNFPEFPLICYILQIHDWNLLDIKTSSSIYYFDSKYYRIYIPNNNTIVFEEYESYDMVELIPMTYNKLLINQESFHTPLDVSNVGGKYSLTKIHNGNVFRIYIPHSLEEVKIVNDILVRENWNFNIFEKYELFYLNGLYWKFKVIDNDLRLIGKYESI